MRYLVAISLIFTCLNIFAAKNFLHHGPSAKVLKKFDNKFLFAREFSECSKSHIECSLKSRSYGNVPEFSNLSTEGVSRMLANSTSYKKNSREIVGGSRISRGDIVKRAGDTSPNNKFSSKVLMSYGDSSRIFKTPAHDYELSDLTDSTKTDFLSIVGFNKSLSEGRALDVNLFVSRSKDSYNLKKSSVSYVEDLEFEDGYFLNYSLGVFIPVVAEINTFTNEKINEVILSPVFSAGRASSFGELSYSFIYYSHTAEISKNGFLNSIKYKNSYKNLNFLYSLSFLSMDSGLETINSISSYYPFKLNKGRELKLAGTLEGRDTNINDITYLLSIMYNF